MKNYDNKYMKIAIEEAKKAFELGEVPVGCVIVKNNKIISKSFNTKEKNNNALYHAEIKCIDEASKTINNWRLLDCDVYVTLDPCPMCASALKQSRVRNVYSALESQDKENSFIINKIFESDKNNSGVNFYSNLLVEESDILLKDFFKKQRNK